jgi:hypothetical protein
MSAVDIVKLLQFCVACTTHSSLVLYVAAEPIGIPDH